MTTTTEKAGLEPEAAAFVAEMQAKVRAHKDTRGVSWATLATEMGAKQGTLSTWATESYAGDTVRIAELAQRYFTGLEARAALARTALRDPGFIETSAAASITNVLRWAHTGEIVVVACAPGIGKTRAAERYKATAANVWLATCSPSSGGIQTMLNAVLEEMGDGEVKGSPYQLSRRVRERVRGANALIVFDEAQELNEQALDEIRSWHDKVGVGIALVGDERVLTRLRSGARARQLARLGSRVSMPFVQAKASADDAALIVRGWGIEDEASVAFLAGLAGRQGALRSIVKTIKLAAILAGDPPREVGLADLKAAWAQLRTDVQAAA
jgi:hypothetical protein